LLRACFQSFQVLQRVRPDVVLGFGGYISLPAGLVTVLRRIPLVLHEQNAIAGMANLVLSKVAARIFTAFPNVMKKAQWVGNPLRDEFLNQAEASERFSGRIGPMKVLVVGGSLGARALNAVVPLALAKIPLVDRPSVMHQSGDKEIDTLRNNYFDANVEATLTPFIDNTAQAFADADIVICRAGASTVTEIAAIGAAALFVPFPGAVDDHQTHNAQFLTNQGAGWTIQQSELTPAYLAAWLQSMNRNVLKDCAEKAKTLACLNATQAIAQACEELAQ
jgi:UDP-N-acetylglucosamine--N-acetylmuramyl-(pentapeptide) pyrophosphoryl-undecaprenol N-acetylglucosamine transferase